MDMIDFCNDINFGFEPRTSKLGHVYLKAGDEKKKINQKPELPYPWNEYIIDYISAKVIQKINNKIGIIDIGSNDSIFIGQKYYIFNPESIHNIEMIVIRATGKESSLIEITSETNAPNWGMGYLISNKFPTETK